MIHAAIIISALLELYRITVLNSFFKKCIDPFLFLFFNFFLVVQRLCAQRATSRRRCFPAASGWATATAASTRSSTPARVANSSGPSPRSCAVAGAGRRRRRRAGLPPEDISTSRTSRHRLISARLAGTRRWRTSRRQPPPPPT